MPPRILQWLPVDAFDEIFLVPRTGQEAAFSRRAGELGPIVELRSARAQVYATGTNIDGGWIDVGEEQPYARIAEASIDDIARAVAEMIDHIEPTRFLVRDYDGTRAVHVAEDIEILDLPDWRRHVVGEGEPELVVAAVTEAIDARGGPRPDDLADLEELVALVPDQFAPQLLAARLYLDRDRLDDAERAARAVLALDIRDYRKVTAYTVLGEVATRRGDPRGALAQHQLAAKAAFQPHLQRAVGVAAIRAGEHQVAWDALVPNHRGRSLFEIAEAMCALGRLGDARAFLRIALEIEPKLLQPVPANQWPKPPDTAWTAPHPELAALVAQAGRN